MRRLLHPCRHDVTNRLFDSFPDAAADRSMSSLEILHSAFVLFSGGARFKGAEIFSLFCFGVCFLGIQPVFAAL